MNCGTAVNTSHVDSCRQVSSAKYDASNANARKVLQESKDVEAKMFEILQAKMWLKNLV